MKKNLRLLAISTSVFSLAPMLADSHPGKENQKEFNIQEPLPDEPLRDIREYSAPLLPLNSPNPILIRQDLKRKLMAEKVKREGLIEETLKSKNIPWSMFVGLALMGALFLSFRFQKKAHTVQEVKKNTPSLDEAESILQLGLSQGWSKSLTEKYFTSLRTAMRLFVENTYGLLAPSETTEEFLYAASSTLSIDEKKRLNLIEFFSLVDQVQFGNYQPTKDEVLKAFQIAKTLLHNQL